MIPYQHLFHRHTSLQLSTQSGGRVKVLCKNHWLQLVLSNESGKFMHLGNSFIFAMHLHNSFIFVMHLYDYFIFNMHLWNSCMLVLDEDTEDANAEDEDAKVDRPLQPHHVSSERRLRLIRSEQIDYHRSLQPATSLSKLVECSDFVVDRGMISQLSSRAHNSRNHQYK